jgi:hypothetical protein
MTNLRARSSSTCTTPHRPSTVLRCTSYVPPGIIMNRPRGARRAPQNPRKPMPRKPQRRKSNAWHTPCLKHFAALNDEPHSSIP